MKGGYWAGAEPDGEIWVEEKEMIYVAVVCALWNRSGRNEGSWGCFVDKNKSDAIRLAALARDKWEDKGYGPYQILVGTLTEELVPPTPNAYRLAPITDRGSPGWDGWSGK